MANAQILIVEDEIFVAEEIQSRLKDLGYAVSGIASSGEEAITKAAKMRPDLVLMDIRLSGEMDGVEAAEQIRDCLNIPVIYLTAYADENTWQRAKTTKPYRYVLKPFKERELHIAIEMSLYKHKAEEKLRQYTAELEARNEELDAFAYTVAHNLKGPLTSIIVFADLAEKDYATVPNEELQECLHAVARSGLKMSNIINELLLLAEVRKMEEVTIEPLDMASTVAEAQGRVAHLIEEYQAEIILPDAWSVALGYGPWVEEVWVNYISNAIKYGGQPPRVELGAMEQAHGTVRFWVRDNGPGLSPEDQAHLFTPFTQLHQIRAEGHGLGLSIVRRIVERLGGQVGVKSQMGQGSVFSFTLPGTRQ